jgi:excisionase family DNA binding protein
VENPEVIAPINRSRDSLDDLPALISVPQAAEILGLKRATAYRYAALGELPVRRFSGRRVYVVTAKLRALIEHGDEVAA